VPSEHCVVVGQQLVERDVAADLAVQHELDAHALQQHAARLDDFLLQLEGRDAEGQQAADARVAVVHHGAHAVACQHVGGGQPRGAGADDRYLACRSA
jgi:hypothetical protein